MLRLALLSIFTFYAGLIFAQSDSPFVDSIQKSLDEKTQFSIGLDSRNSFVSSEPAQINGIKIGVDFGDNFSVGGGFHTLSTHLYKIEYFNDNGYEIPMVAKLKLNYLAYYMEYVFYRDKHWVFTIPVQVGFGYTFYQYPHPLKKNTESFVWAEKGFVMMYEPSMSATYNFFDWFGIGLDVGYRLMLKNNKAIKQQFTAPIYVFSSKLYYGVLWKKFKTNILKSNVQ